MKQRKKTTSSSKVPQRNYFNPYETKTQERTSTRTTYNEYIRSQNSEEKVEKTNAKVISSNKKSSNKKSSSKVSSSKNKLVSKKSVASQTSSKKGQVSKKPRTQSKNRTKKITQSNENLSPEQRRAQMRKKVKMTPSQKRRMRRKRRYQSAAKILLVMCMTICVVWGGISLREFLIKPSISTQIVKMGTLDTSHYFEGVIFRNEKVVYSEESGNVRYVIAEGEKVKKEGLVYVLVDEKNLVTTTTEKEAVDTQIYNQAENSAALSNKQDERYNLDQQVKSHLEDFYNNRYEQSTHYIYTLRSQLESSVANRTNLYAEEQEEKNQELVALKEQLEADLGNYQKGKASSESGIISYQMDGNETEQAKTAIDSLNYETYNKMKRTASLRTLGQSEISAEEPIYKVILNNEWHIVTYAEAKEVAAYAVGQNYTIYFDDVKDHKVEFKLESKKEEGNRVQLVFTTNNQMNDFLNSRVVKVSIGEKETSGLKIPNQAIVEQNLIKIPIQLCTDIEDKIYVYRQKGEITETIELDVQYTKDEMYYIRQDLTNVDQVQVNDILVNQSDGSTYQVAEVETKQGVYVINNKVAKFKEIDISVQGDEYAIVKYTGKSQLKEMDKIISNPKSIKINQLVDGMKIQNE